MADTKKTFAVEVSVLFLLIYFVMFLKLGSFHMRWWDESMFAVNTYEMMENGKIFTPHFDGIPDMFNTKPPLTSWIQIVFVKLFGYNELSLRLPSALASALSVLLVFSFLHKKYNRIWAWSSAMIMLTSIGFIGFHTARTADSDALLTFFLLCSSISFFNFLRENEQKFVFEQFFSLRWLSRQKCTRRSYSRRHFLLFYSGREK